MVSETFREISDTYKNSFNNCIICGKHPIIKNYFDDVSGDDWSYITCPNEHCDNKISFNDHLSRLVNVWNDNNPIDVYQPSVEPHQFENSCFFCKHVSKCKYGKRFTDEQRKYNSCKDFQKPED